MTMTLTYSNRTHTIGHRRWLLEQNFPGETKIF